MANPRKFSEKIALHNQKQAEETAAFEKIMREVSDATSKVIINFQEDHFFYYFFFSSFFGALFKLINILQIFYGHLIWCR